MSRVRELLVYVVSATNAKPELERSEIHGKTYNTELAANVLRGRRPSIIFEGPGLFLPAILNRHHHNILPLSYHPPY